MLLLVLLTQRNDLHTCISTLFNPPHTIPALDVVYLLLLLPQLHLQVQLQLQLLLLTLRYIYKP
jgi:hypothetical protein